MIILNEKVYKIPIKKRMFTVTAIDGKAQGYTEEQLKENHKQFEIGIKLHINKRLYEEGNITKEMFEKAKYLIQES